MSKVIKNSAGRYFVAGRGFVGTVAEATSYPTLSQAQAKVEDLVGLGFAPGTIENAPAPVDGSGAIQNRDGTSFACYFIRPKDLNADGSVKSNKRNPSSRRFKTQSEAQHHASRMVAAFGHRGYYVVKTNDPVNAWINSANGLTNPEIGKKRLNLKAKS